MAELVKRDDGWYIHLESIWDHGVAGGMFNWEHVRHHVGPFTEDEARTNLEKLQEGVEQIIQEHIEAARTQPISDETPE